MQLVVRKVVIVNIIGTVSSVFITYGDIKWGRKYEAKIEA